MKGDHKYNFIECFAEYLCTVPAIWQHDGNIRRIINRSCDDDRDLHMLICELAVSLAVKRKLEKVRFDGYMSLRRQLGDDGLVLELYRALFPIIRDNTSNSSTAVYILFYHFADVMLKSFGTGTGWDLIEYHKDGPVFTSRVFETIYEYALREYYIRVAPDGYVFLPSHMTSTVRVHAASREEFDRIMSSGVIHVMNGPIKKDYFCTEGIITFVAKETGTAASFQMMSKWRTIYPEDHATAEDGTGIMCEISCKARRFIFPILCTEDLIELRQLECMYAEYPVDLTIVYIEDKDSAPDTCVMLPKRERREE